MRERSEVRMRDSPSYYHPSNSWWCRIPNMVCRIPNSNLWCVGYLGLKPATANKQRVKRLGFARVPGVTRTPKP
jgi:hypothetical protein